MRTAAAIISAVLPILACGCEQRTVAPASATISWIHPRLSQPTQPVAITDSLALARLPRLFSGYDRPPPNAPAHDPPMYDCVIAMVRPDGTHADIKVYLPRPGIFPGMWRHPKGQLLYFDDDTGKAILKLVTPYLPKELQSDK